MPNNFCAPFKSARSSRTLLSTSMILDPARSCITSPEVTIGVIPSSMTVPRLEARITRIQ
uniref:Protein transport protein Sec61 subunit alpha n=1 Tax=Rhizophora mucronata TaxID=61149 RepID=A0A2P2KV88_RHIMU